MRLIVGLGNPEKKYDRTRHNAGFMFVDFLREKFHEEFNFDDWQLCKKLQSATSYGKFHGEKIILLKPQTFMNLSGEAVSAAVKYYKIKPEEMVIVHDDIDLPLGAIRIRSEGSSGGHKGLESIISQTGTKFARIKIGIGAPLTSSGQVKIPSEKYVLAKFTKKEEKILARVLDEAVKLLLKYQEEGLKEETVNIKP